MIDECLLLEDLEEFIEYDNFDIYQEEPKIYMTFQELEDVIANQPKVDVTDTNVGNKWIPCSERLPEEHDSMFKKFKGTNKWNDAMFETISNKVNVTIEFENGKRTTDTSHTTDGKWRCEKEYGLGTKVIAWQPLPEAYKEGKQ